MIRAMVKHFSSLLLCLVLVLSLLPTEVLAEAMTVTVAGLTVNSSDTITAAENSISVTVGISGCNGTKTNTLTLTNNGEKDVTLKFDYSIARVKNGGSMSVKFGSDAEITGEQSGSKSNVQISAGKSYTVECTANTTSDSEESFTLDLTNIVADAGSVTVTFVPPTKGGSIKVAGDLVGENREFMQSSTDSFSVEAISEDGYQFFGWYDISGDTENFLSSNAKTNLNFVNDTKVTAKFAPEGSAIFRVEAERFYDLGEATKYASESTSKLITVIADGAVGTGDYTIPDGVTLHIPFDSDGTRFGSGKDEAVIYENISTSPYRTLTLLNGANICVEGAVEVGGRYYAPGGSETGRVIGPFGWIRMEDGSSITVKEDGNLYAWGFISGNGSVHVCDNATVYEFFQLMFRGGTSSNNMRNTEVFPISQYFIQNIEVPMTFTERANEITYTGVYATKMIWRTSVNFISSSSGLFAVTNGTFTKDYDEATDRLIFTLNEGSSAELNSIVLKLSMYSFSSSDYDLPITNNVTVNIKRGATLKINSDVAILPGVKINIEEGGTAIIPNGVNAYLYDSNEWFNLPEGGSANYAYEYYSYVQIPYVAPDKTKHNRSQSELTDAQIDINGTLTVEGALYTTSSGAAIVSSEGTGRYIQNVNPGTQEYTAQCTQSSGSVTKKDIAITPAKLCNKDDSYTETARATAGDIYTYCNNHCKGKWVCSVAQVGTSDVKYFTLQAAAAAANGETVTMLHDTTEDTISADGFVLDLAGCAVNANLTGSFSGFDSTSTTNADGETGYFVPTGKITGKADSVAKTYQTPETDGEFQRYVAVKNSAGETTFHRFNISVTGFRVLFNPGDVTNESGATTGHGSGALFFEAQFRGDDAVVGAVKSISFEFTGSDKTDESYEKSETKPIQNSEVFISDAAWDGTLVPVSGSTTANSNIVATASITFTDGTIFRSDSTQQGDGTSYISALRMVYDSEDTTKFSMEMTADDSTLRPKDVIDGFMKTYGTTLGWIA